MLAHVLLDSRVCVPLFAVALVAADMEVGVGKQGGHFAYEAIEKLVGAFTRGVHSGVEDAPVPLDEIRPFATGEVGVADEPGGSVAWHVELRNYADTAVAGVLDNAANLVLRVEVSIRSLLLQEWIEFAFDAK